MNRKFIEKMMEAKACEREAFAMLLTENTNCQIKELRKECMALFVDCAVKIIKNGMEDVIRDDTRRDQETDESESAKGKSEHVKYKAEHSTCKSIKVE